MIIYDNSNFVLCVNDPEEKLQTFLNSVDSLLGSYSNYKLSDIKIDDKRIYQALILKD